MGGEEGDNDWAGDREGRWRCACVYDCGWSPVKRERSVVFPEPVKEGGLARAYVKIKVNVGAKRRV